MVIHLPHPPSQGLPNIRQRIITGMPALQALLVSRGKWVRRTAPRHRFLCSYGAPETVGTPGHHPGHRPFRRYRTAVAPVAACSRQTCRQRHPGLSLILVLRRHVARRSPRSVLGFELTDDMTWAPLETKEGNIALAILGRTFVAPDLTVLETEAAEITGRGYRLSGAGQKGSRGWRVVAEVQEHAPRSLVILPDAIDAGNI